jgi:ferrous iron transport protein A
VELTQINCERFLLRIESVSRSSPMKPTPPLCLADLPNGSHALVTRLSTAVPGADAALLRRLAEIGFVAGEPVQLLRRGPGGREPLAVQIGDTMFGLRLLEARCIEVENAVEHG